MSNFLDMLQQVLGGQGGDGSAPMGGPPSALPSDVNSLLASNPQGAAPQAQAPAQPTGPMIQPPAGPVTPPTDSGLGGFLSRMVDRATNRDPNTGMSFMDKLGQVGAGMTDQMGDSRGAQAALQRQAEGRVAATQADAKQKQMNALADQLDMSPRERLIFLSDPDAWVKANGQRIGYHEVAGGATGAYGEPGQPGSTTYTAPKVGVENGEGYSVTPTGAKDLGGLQPSPQQMQQNAIRQAQEEAMQTYHQVMARIAQQNADSNTKRANKPALGNGGDWRSRVVGTGSVQ